MSAVTKAERRAEIGLYINLAIQNGQPVAVVAAHRARVESVLARTFPSDTEQVHRADIAAAALAALNHKES